MRGAPHSEADSGYRRRCWSRRCGRTRPPPPRGPRRRTSPPPTGPPPSAGPKGVVSLHISAELSATLESAELAAKDSPIPVRVLDSRTIGMALGFAVLAAARAAAEGHSAQDWSPATRRRPRPAHRRASSTSTRWSTCAAAAASGQPRHSSVRRCRSSRSCTSLTARRAPGEGPRQRPRHRPARGDRVERAGGDASRSPSTTSTPRARGRAGRAPARRLPGLIGSGLRGRCGDRRAFGPGVLGVDRLAVVGRAGRAL